MKGRGYWILPAVITVLALADGALHLALDFVLFRGRLWGSPSFGGGRPGAAPRAGTAAPATRAARSVRRGRPSPSSHCR